MTGSTVYEAKQDVDESNADESKLYTKFKKGELWIYGRDTYRIIKLDLKAILFYVN